MLIALQVESFAYSTDPKQFIAEITSEAKEILNSSNSKKIKGEQLSEMALKTVDIKGLAYSIAGMVLSTSTTGGVGSIISSTLIFFAISIFPFS